MSQVEDAALSHDMLAALVPLPELERAHLRVAVSGDTVVLSGDVPGDREKEIVEDVVWQFRPLHVRNELLVKEAY
jgi:osmotically-inducible protein OsmY